MNSCVKNSFVFASAMCDELRINADRYNVVHELEGLTEPFEGLTAQSYVQYGISGDLSTYQNLYIPSLNLTDLEWDKLIDTALNTRKKLMIRCSTSLQEVGEFDVKYRMSPIFYLYRCGLLNGNTITGAVYLDKDDIALMRQEKADVVLTPSHDLLSGNGVAPVVSMLQGGLSVSLGSYNCAYNKKGNMWLEGYLLKMAVSASLNKKDALKDEDVLKMLQYSEPYSTAAKNNIYNF